MPSNEKQWPSRKLELSEFRNGGKIKSDKACAESSGHAENSNGGHLQSHWSHRWCVVYI